MTGEHAKHSMAKAAAALAGYEDGDECALSDLLADLMHWCAEQPDNPDFDTELDRARRNFDAERAEDKAEQSNAD